MVSRCEIVAPLKLPAAVLEKLPLLDKSIEELLMDKKNSCRSFDEVLLALQALLDETKASTEFLTERESAIKIIRVNDSDSVATAHRNNLSDFLRHMTHTTMKVDGRLRGILALCLDVQDKYLELLNAS
ncbi:MAG: hypothetical protein Q9226_006126 [Calogaya cf. arnoldii]